MEFQDIFTPQGAHVLNNYGGIEIELAHSGEGLRYRFNFGNGPSEAIEAEIVYLENEDLQGTEDNDGTDTFPAFYVGEGENKTAYFLADFMAVCR